MLTVDDYELIRRMHLVEGLSQREVAQRRHHSRKTVAKAIANPIPPPYRRKDPPERPVIDPVRGIIDAWLEQDKALPRKQRHTAQRIYERLRDDYHFSGNPSTVRRYVASARDRQQEVFMPLAFEPGEEGQVDWHEGYVEDGGELVKKQFFGMKLCYSKARFVRSYEQASLEAFLDGHVRAFVYFGGVPGRLAYDNLKSAVIQVGHGQERRLNERFRQLRSWYLFDTRFCNVGRGNEKGDVENLAKRSERTYLTPIPILIDLEQLGQKLLEDCRKDLDLPAPAPHSGKTCRELFEEERRFLLPLPAQPFAAWREESTFAGSESLVRFQTNRYSVPVRWAHHPCVIRAYVDRIELLCQQQTVAAHRRCYDRDQYILTPEHYLRLLERKPGSLDNARPFKGQPWGEDFQKMRKELEYRSGSIGTRAYIEVLLLMAEHDPQEVQAAVSLCVRRRAFAYEAVVSALRNEPVRPAMILDLSDRPELVNVPEGLRPAGLYDQLRLEEVPA